MIKRISSAAMLLSLVALWSAVARADTQNQAAARVELKAGDRIVLVGGSFIERMQANGYFETLLTTRYPRLGLTFRNVGWSGDTVQGIARAVFGTPEEGFARLLKDVRESEPTLILVAYGNNEAHGGSAELPAFEQQLHRLLDELAEICPRIALITPRPYEHAGPRMPDPAPYNEQLAQYAECIRQVAAARNLAVIDLHADALARGAGYAETTMDGVQLTPRGYWTVSLQLAELLGSPPSPWRLDYNAANGSYNAVNVSVQDVDAEPQRIRWSLLDRELPPSPPPGALDAAAAAATSAGTLRVRGLEEGKYQLLIDGLPIVEATADEWASGCELPLRGGHEQVAQLRSLIGEKNEYYFHRYRPQNETYLFLFRKHEQGNNAVEIPQFDPLIAEHEKRIASLAAPQRHVYELVRTH